MRSRYQDTCSVCDGTRFWTSRTGYFVCQVCAPDAMTALLVLSRYGGEKAMRVASTILDAYLALETSHD